MTSTIDTKDILIELPCKHSVSYLDIKKPCAVCNHSEAVFSGVTGTLYDELDKVYIQVFKCFLDKELGVKPTLSLKDGKLKLELYDLPTKKTIELTTTQLHDIHKQLTESYELYSQIAKRHISVLMCILDKDYKKLFITRLGGLKSKLQVFIRKYALALTGGSITTTVISILGTLLLAL